MKRLKVVASWASKVIESGPQAARDSAADILEEVNIMIDHRRDWDEDYLLENIADECLELCLGHFIKAPPGIHRKLLRDEDYRQMFS